MNAQSFRKEWQGSIQARLAALGDSAYRDFMIRLLPNISPDGVMGVRTPALRNLARELEGTSQESVFLSSLPHVYFEENQLHGFLIGRMKDFHQAMAATEAFLPFVDNWATCDQLSPGVFQKDLPRLYQKICLWTASDQPYTVRFGLEMLMRYYLDGAFRPEILELAAGVQREDYYVKMMVAWFFATALAKQYQAALPYLEQRRLETWTHNKTIQKAIESDRVGEKEKAYLRTLRLKADTGGKARR